MGQTSKFITIIRPEFMEFCKDACRAAALNHLFYRIAGKCKDQPKEKIQAGEILWYGSNELITEEMSNAWGVCKVRKEVNELIGMNLFGKTSNPDWGADRTKHFFFGTEQCAKFLQLCEEHNICFVHLDLPDEVKHLIYSSNANDEYIKCTCKQPEMVDANDKSIKCNSYIHPMETMNISNANDKSIEAITKNTTKINNIEDNEERESIPAPESLTPTLSPPVVGDSRAFSSSGDIDEAMIREVIAQSSLSSEGEITEEFIQSTIDAFKRSVLVELRARTGLSEHPDDQLPGEYWPEDDDPDKTLPGVQAVSKPLVEPAHKQNHSAEPPNGAVVGDVPLGTPPAQGAASPKGKDTPEDAVLQGRCREWYKRITDHCGGPMTKGGQVINEHRAVKSLCQKYDDRQLEAIFKRLTTKHWKWSKIDNKFNVRAFVILDEASGVAQALKEEREQAQGKLSDVINFDLPPDYDVAAEFARYRGINEKFVTETRGVSYAAV